MLAEAEATTSAKAVVEEQVATGRPRPGREPARRHPWWGEGSSPRPCVSTSVLPPVKRTRPSPPSSRPSAARTGATASVAHSRASSVGRSRTGDPAAGRRGKRPSRVIHVYWPDRHAVPTTPAQVANHARRGVAVAPRGALFASKASRSPLARSATARGRGRHGPTCRSCRRTIEESSPATGRSRRSTSTRQWRASPVSRCRSFRSARHVSSSKRRSGPGSTRSRTHAGPSAWRALTPAMQ